MVTPNTHVESRKVRNRAKALIIGGCTAALVAGGSLAFFTDTDMKANDFTIAQNLKIKVEEPNWDPDDAKDLVPLQVVDKDPAVKNVSGTQAWIIAQVEVPVANVATVGADGKKQAAAQHELFTYQLNSQGWKEDGTAKLNKAGTHMVHTYLAPAAVDVDGKTPNIFDTVQLINLVEGQLSADQLSQQINVIGYGVQTEGFDDVDKAWAAYQAQNALN